MAVPDLRRASAAPRHGPPRVRRAAVAAVLGVAGLLVLLTGPAGAGVPVAAALVLAARAARRRSHGRLATGLLLVAAAPVGLLLWQALQIAGCGTGAAPLLHALAVAAWAAGTAGLVAGVLVLTAAWVRTSGQLVGPAVSAVAAVGAVAGWNVLWWAWWRAFDLADAGRSTAAYDPVQAAAGLTVLACAGLGLLAAVVTLVRAGGRRRPGRAAR